MKTVIFNGSPRKNGDTAALVRMLAEELTGPAEQSRDTGWGGSGAHHDASEKDTGNAGEISCAYPHEVRIIRSYDTDIRPCIDCRFCRTHRGCAIDDGMREVYRQIEAADNIILATPLYFAAPTGPLLALMSRLQTYFSARYFRREEPFSRPKKGAVILVGGGSGRTEPAEYISRMILTEMGCTEILPAVISHNTDRLPAAEDSAAVEGIREIARFFR